MRSFSYDHLAATLQQALDAIEPYVPPHDPTVIEADASSITETPAESAHTRPLIRDLGRSGRRRSGTCIFAEYLIESDFMKDFIIFYYNFIFCFAFFLVLISGCNSIRSRTKMPKQLPQPPVPIQ